MAAWPFVARAAGAWSGESIPERSMPRQKQDSLGIKSWESYASEAGISDLRALSACAASPDSARRVASGLQFAKSIGAFFTPTVIVNGWRLSGTPDRYEMDRVIAALLKGDSPYPQE